METPTPERILIDAAVALTHSLDVQHICGAAMNAAQLVCGARSAWLMLLDEERDELVVEGFRGPGADIYAGVRVPRQAATLSSLAFSSREPQFVPDVRAETRWFNPERVQQSGLVSMLLVPVMYADRPVGVIGVDSDRFWGGQRPSELDLARLRGIAALAAIAIRNARLVNSIDQDRSRLRRLLSERRHLRQEVDHLRHVVQDAHPFKSIIGSSAMWQAVLEQVEIVAPADSTVLLSGETGTGKELIARAIHEQSRRRRQPFVAINCAAFPESLVESELFGHERGAFTGAVDRKPGKFELADKGTLFLDEVGELPAPVQAKLLRALQEREIQRVGGTKTVPVNVRLVAATNRDLEDAIQNGSFRQDLFYRLNVFPIILPPLRDRPEDVAVLAQAFLGRFARREGRRVPELTRCALRALESYHWPGNVRELQNVLERAMLLCRGSELDARMLYLPEGGDAARHVPAAALTVHADKPAGNVLLFAEAERRAILEALEMAGWRISGSSGAAAALGLKPTTLHAKMKRLGIRRPSAICADEKEKTVSTTPDTDVMAR